MLNKKNSLIGLLLLIYGSCFCQVSTANVRYINNTLIDVLDLNVNQLFSFTMVQNYLDGTAMDISKCDDVIYIKYKNKYYKRNYEIINIRWFGCNESNLNNQSIINRILAKYKTAYVPEGLFKFSETIIVPENSMLYGSGKSSILKLISKKPVDGISLYRWSSLKDLKLDCTETNMDLSAGVLVNSWDNVSSTAGETQISNLTIVGNYPQLQGIGIKLQTASRVQSTYSIISFCKFLDIDIYGFRDGIVCDLKYDMGISFINANIFSNIIIYNCLRPVRMINSAPKSDITSGKSNISSNFFSNIIIQHAVGNYPAFFIEGGDNNEINVQIFDWPGLYLEETNKSRHNSINNFPKNAGKVKFNTSY